MKNLKIVLITVILTIAIVVALQNTEPVETKFLFASFEMPRMLLIIVIFTIGICGGLIASSLLRKKSTKPKKDNTKTFYILIVPYDYNS